jgi:hypothetical protein
MIQRGRPTNLIQRKRGREVFHAEHAPPASPEYLNWSEHPIGFDQSDHPPKIPHPGHHALVLEAQIGGFTSKKVFMDGVSSLNLIYADTLRKIMIPMNDLLPTETSFHGIVPGKPTYPLGVIHLDVIFGTPANFRKEKIEFEVVKWPSQYHASLGRPTFARFMAVPHYAYLKMRMLANRGPLMISGSFARSENCDKDFNTLSQTFGIHEELNHIRESTSMDIDPPAQQNAQSYHSTLARTHGSTRSTRRIPPRLRGCRIPFPPHWKAHSSSSSVSTGGCLPGVQQICQASPRNSPSTN